MKRAPWIAAGALGAWLLDGTNGEERRRRLRARFEEILRPSSSVLPPVDLDLPEERAA